jgi:DUF2075 family protein
VGPNQSIERGQIKLTEPPEAEFINLVKQTYRILLTRGMKGCYAYFVDKNSEEFFRSRIESLS